MLQKEHTIEEAAIKNASTNEVVSKRFMDCNREYSWSRKAKKYILLFTKKKKLSLRDRLNNAAAVTALTASAAEEDSPAAQSNVNNVTTVDESKKEVKLPKAKNRDNAVSYLTKRRQKEPNFASGLSYFIEESEDHITIVVQLRPTGNDSSEQYRTVKRATKRPLESDDHPNEKGKQNNPHPLQSKRRRSIFIGPLFNSSQTKSKVPSKISLSLRSSDKKLIRTGVAKARSRGIVVKSKRDQKHSRSFRNNASVNLPHSVHVEVDIHENNLRAYLISTASTSSQLSKDKPIQKSSSPNDDRKLFSIKQSMSESVLYTLKSHRGLPLQISTSESDIAKLSQTKSSVVP